MTGYETRFERSPLAVVAAAFGAGIALGWWLKPAAWELALLAALAAAFCRLAKRRQAAANGGLLFLILLAGIARAGVDGVVSPSALEREMTAEPKPVTCEGIVAGDEEWVLANGRMVGRRVWLKIVGVKGREGWVPRSGKVLAHLPAQAPPAEYGDRLLVHGMIRRGKGTREGERFNEAGWLWANGACGVLSVAEPESVKRLSAGGGGWAGYRRRVARLRRRLQGVGRGLMGPAEAGILEAFLLGEGKGVPPEALEAFRRTGTVHILVVSGFQVGLIGLIGLGVLSSLSCPRRLRYLLLAGILAGYCTLTGADPPILRATVMGILLCLAQGLGYESAGFNLLGAAGLAILTLHPRALADVGFQLSFAAVGGILLAAKTVPGRNLRPSNGSGRTVWKGIAQAAAVSVGAWAATLPILGWHFRSVSFLAPAANLVVVPWGSLLAGTGVVVYGAGLVSPTAAAPFAGAFSALARLLVQLVSWMAGLPGTFWQW